MPSRIIKIKFDVVNKNRFSKEQLEIWYNERFESIKDANLEILKIDDNKIISVKLITTYYLTDEKEILTIERRKKIEAEYLFDMLIDIDDDGNYPINNNLVEPRLLKYKFIKF